MQPPDIGSPQTQHPDLHDNMTTGLTEGDTMRIRGLSLVSAV
jgi:hypothetical protein